ncbi:MAG: hypothetical protein RLN81_13865 [Balneolaceae bacterium]
MPDRIFSEKEIQEIIKRAAALQKSGDSKADKEKNGLTMEELISIGEDAGLDVKYLQTAALEYRDRKVVRYSGLTDTHIFEEREFNTEVPQDIVWDDVISELTHHFGGDTFGKTNENHHKKEWTHTSVSGIETIVSLTKRDTHSKLRLSQRVGLGSPLTESIMYGIILAAILLGLVAAAFKPASIRDIILIGSGLWGISSMIVYALDVSWRKKKLRNLKTLADKIIGQLPSSIKDVTSKSSSKEKNTSEIEIESLDTYGLDKSGSEENNNLKNDLRE